MLPEENKKLDEEAKAYNKVVDGQTAFKEFVEESKKRKWEVSKPVIRDGKIIFTIKIPLEWIQKHWESDK